MLFAGATTKYYEQNMLNKHVPRLRVDIIWEDELISKDLTDFLQSSSTKLRATGLDAAYTRNGRLTCLAVAVGPRILLIRFRNNQKANATPPKARTILNEVLLCNPENVHHAFDMHVIALALYNDMRMFISNAVDIQSACTCKEPRDVGNAVEFAVSSTEYPNIHRSNIAAVFTNEAHTWDERKPTGLAFRAWLAGHLPSISDMELRFAEVKKISTDTIAESVCPLICDISDSLMEEYRLLTGSQELFDWTSAST